jgi:hypothetical protein
VDLVGELDELDAELELLRLLIELRSRGVQGGLLLVELLRAGI